VLHAIYKPLLDKNIPIVSANLETAELIKYASNAFLATKIAFINEIADLSEKCGADIRNISLGVGLDSRIGEKFLKPGPGFGGSCFPKDICALSNYAKNSKSDFLVLDAVIKSNKERPANLVNKFAQFFDNDFTGKCLAILGLAFKAGTDDIRSSPAIEIIKILLAKGANIIAYDPAAMENARKILPEVKYADSALDACINADAVIILTEWPEFKELNFKDIYRQSKKPIIVDLRGILPVTELIEQGFVCYTIGRKYEN
jgi:UDPglucose 6-dehydrogenase